MSGINFINLFVLHRLVNMNHVVFWKCWCIEHASVGCGSGRGMICQRINRQYHVAIEMSRLWRENEGLFGIECCVDTQVIEFKHINVHVSEIKVFEVSKLEVVYVFEIEVVHIAKIEVIEVKIEVDYENFPRIHAIHTTSVRCVWEQTNWGVISVKSVLCANKNERPTSLLRVIIVIVIVTI